jgi:putative toxin-antitoxin system antitoxin component (TIGR02293 family)
MTIAHLSDATQPWAMAAFLGLARPKSFTGLMLADTIKAGVPLSSVERVSKQIDPEGHHFGAGFIMAKATYHRRVKDAKPLSRDDSEKLWQVARVYLLVRSLYGNDEYARAFLFRPHPLLDQRRPIDLATDSAVGAALVEDLVFAADAGVAV